MQAIEIGCARRQCVYYEQRLGVLLADEPRTEQCIARPTAMG